MGNVPISCCRSKSPRLDSESRSNGVEAHFISSHDSRKLSNKSLHRHGHGPDDGDPLSSMHQSSQNILQHISEREPDDTETDPSSNPLNRPIFVQRSFNSNSNEDRCKASSCSTIYIDNSTISQPNLDQTIKCVSLAIYYHIKNRLSDNVSEIFDETIHPLKMPAYPHELTVNNNISKSNSQQQATFQQQQIESKRPVQRQTYSHQHQGSTTTTNTEEKLIILDNDDGVTQPDQEVIYNFVRTLFKAAQLTSEYAITTLVYLERLITYAEMDLTPKSWRRMFLGALLLSSKVWEDQAIWNVDYAQILEEISVDDINELERQFLELIQFNMNVPSSVYAKYYFHLRTLALQNGLTEEQTLLTTGHAKELEVS